MAYAVFLLAAFSGFAAICAGSKRHYGQVFGRPITPRPALMLKLAGSVLLAIAWAACAYCWGAGIGTVAWVCVLPMAATAVVACLTFSPRSWLRKAGVGAAAITLVLSLALLGSAALAAPAGKAARCVLKTSDPSDYSGPCLFTQGPKGSFGLGPAKGKFLLDVFTSISVDIVTPDKAEVRGLTADGVNSRWGEAKRGKRDPACWQGDDFSICVY